MQESLWFTQEKPDDGDGLTEINEHSSALNSQFDELHRHSRTVPPPPLADRKRVLKALGKTVLERQARVAQSISADFSHRSVHETKLADIYTLLSTIQYTLKHIDQWAKPRPRTITFPFLPGQGEVLPQPLGLVGILAPWNYPFSLALTPFVSAVAAGNRVLLKPSEHTPRTSQLIQTLVEDIFPREWAQVSLGDAEHAKEFSSLRFDHLCFTGSSRVGRDVMRAASEHLVPVTLELGGKSPALIHSSYSMSHAVRRIVAGKMLNAGQTCIAPDYALVPKHLLDTFVDAYQKEVERCYPSLISNPDYTSIINASQRERLRTIASEAKEAGTSMVVINPAHENDDDSQKMLPILAVDPPKNSALMSEEIFGPILPLIPYTHLDSAIAFINERPRPLAFYYFDRDRTRIRKVLNETISGGACINDTMMHFVQDDLPFGGVGASGMGRYHGREGFDSFSNLKSVFHQSKLSGNALLSPPYGKRINLLLKLFLK